MVHPTLQPAPPPPAASRDLAVSVKALCAFSAKAGDLDLRFAPAPSAQQGIAGHRLVQGRRGSDYQSEVALSSRCAGLHVRGRADGYDPRQGRVEEIKTYRGAFESIRANHRALHWAQARTYAWMLCERDALDAVTVALVYLDLATNEETVIEAHCERDALRVEFEALCARFLSWALQEAAHRTALEDASNALAFPHAGLRTGQRALAEGVFRAAAAGRCLIAQAPTGIGKTVATLFPLLKGLRAQKTDKIFFLTAKTSGRAVALEALVALEGPGPACGALRVLELAAREKVCEYPGRACNGEACPRARGFYDRLPAARSTAVVARRLDLAQLRQIANAHEVCPYFLAQEMASWSDVIVADYNYYFDGSAFLFALARAEEWKVAVLVDEAHNLVERGRAMYSARLDEALLEAVGRSGPRPVRPALAHLLREWRSLSARQAARHAAQDEIPERLERAVKDAVATVADHLAAEPAHAEGALLQLFFDLVGFARLADSFGDHSVLESTLADSIGDGGAHDPQSPALLEIRNLIPAAFLRGRFAASMTTVCFSGTIAPFAFYKDMLGLPGDTAELDIASPFDASQLSVRVAMDVSTRFRDRPGSLAALVGLMGAQFHRRPGNYLAFFNSFDYLARARDAFVRQHPDIAVWTQANGMSEADRNGFIARFEAGGRGIGFAVLGGVFGEGIDLPGDRLIGAFIAGLGLPHFSEMNEVLRVRLDERFERGWDYTYLFPGLRKVIQAAGRVIRTEDDTGVLFLMDDRFARTEVRRLLPPWWKLELHYQDAPNAQHART